MCVYWGFRCGRLHRAQRHRLYRDLVEYVGRYVPARAAVVRIHTAWAVCAIARLAVPRSLRPPVVLYKVLGHLATAQTSVHTSKQVQQ